MNEIRRVPARSRRDQPISARQVVDVALQIVHAEGFDALSMRRVATELNTGAASLYVHVRNKAELDDLMLGTLSSRIALPKPDPLQWRSQVIEVCVQLRDQYLQHPGIAQAAMAVVPSDLDTLRLHEGLFGILLAGGFPPRVAAWAIDAIALYVAAYAFERFLAARRLAGELDWLTDPDAVATHLSGLPSTEFPLLRQHAHDLTGGAEHDRFDFALHLLLDGLSAER
jgi:AcrR family transcriptional regulator